ncbi:MAG TPA: TIGR00289 family protein [Thermoplasmatales archaeon]|nr:TIGR00289 family protein [Thermoplasmatales archaeon]
MKVVALVSGGKDSIYATYVAIQYGWEVTHLITMIPATKDSWMFHGINLHLMPLIAENMSIPLLTKHTKGEKEKELDDLEEVLRERKVEGVVSGAVASDYQRTRINHVCDGLRLRSFTPLWHKNPEQLLRWQVEAGFEVTIVSVSAEGLGKEWLGEKISEENIDRFIDTCRRNRIHVAGEGGEFETLVTDCPLYKKKVVIKDMEVKWKRNHGIMVITKVQCVGKKF